MDVQQQSLPDDDDDEMSDLRIVEEYLAETEQMQKEINGDEIASLQVSREEKESREFFSYMISTIEKEKLKRN